MEEYDTQRLKDVLIDSVALDANFIKIKIIDSVKIFSGEAEQADDLTVVAKKIL